MGNASGQTVETSSSTIKNGDNDKTRRTIIKKFDELINFYKSMTKDSFVKKVSDISSNTITKNDLPGVYDFILQNIEELLHKYAKDDEPIEAEDITFLEDVHRLRLILIGSIKKKK